MQLTRYQKLNDADKTKGLNKQTLYIITHVINRFNNVTK
jgi:hypothetical protein